MRISHATAIALVGWYLIIPPIVGKPPRALPSAGFGEWKTMNVFDSVAKCKKARAELRALGTKDLKINPKTYYLGSRPHDPTHAKEWDERVARMKAALADAVHDAGCIASDDPRLKGR